MRTSGKILAFLAVAALANAALAIPVRAQSPAELEARYRGEISGDPASLAAHLGLAEAVAAQGRTGEAVARLLDIGSHYSGGIVITCAGADADDVTAGKPAAPADSGVSQRGPEGGRAESVEGATGSVRG